MLQSYPRCYRRFRRTKQEKRSKNVSEVVSLGGRIYIRGSGIIENSCTSPPDLVGFNLVFINIYDEGQAYTVKEHKDWLEEAGFCDFERIILPDESSIITARKIR